MYPKDIRALTSLRFAAAVWVLLYYFGSHPGIGLARASGFVDKGYLGVDLFFILSGFILSHVYLPRIETGAFDFRGFLWNRFARVYPVHLVTLVAVVAIWVVALRLGVRFDATVFDPSALPANLLLVQAWGVQPAVSWNFPAWSLSAEAFAYLAFPAFVATAAFMLRSGARGALAAALAVYGAMFAAAAFGGGNLNEMTAQIGALRIVPAFLLGAVLHRIGRDARLSPRAVRIGLAASVAWILVSTSLRLPDAVTWPALGGLVFGLAETSKFRAGVLAGSTLVHLGEVSYGVYMVHMPVDLVYFHALAKFVPHPTPLLAAGLWAGVFPVVLGVAIASFHLVERPARLWLRSRDPFSRFRTDGRCSSRRRARARG